MALEFNAYLRPLNGLFSQSAPFFDLSFHFRRYILGYLTAFFTVTGCLPVAHPPPPPNLEGQSTVFITLRAGWTSYTP